MTADGRRSESPSEEHPYKSALQKLLVERSPLVSLACRRRNAQTVEICRLRFPAKHEASARRKALPRVKPSIALRGRATICKLSLADPIRTVCGPLSINQP